MKTKKKQLAVLPEDVERIIAVEEYRQRKADADKEARENPLLPVFTAAEFEELEEVDSAIHSLFEILNHSDNDEALRVASVLRPLVNRLSDLVSPAHDRCEHAVQQIKKAAVGKAVA